MGRTGERWEDREPVLPESKYDQAVPIALAMARDCATATGYDPDELESAALYLGALKAWKTYDPTHPSGASWETFARKLIYFALIEAMRDYGKNRGGSTRSQWSHVSLSTPVGHDDSGLDLEDVIGQVQDFPETLAARSEAEALLDRLRPEEQFVMRARFWLELPNGQIGQMLDPPVSDGRVSQIIKECLARLRFFAQHPGEIYHAPAEERPAPKRPKRRTPRDPDPPRISIQPGPIVPAEKGATGKPAWQLALPL